MAELEKLDIRMASDMGSDAAIVKSCPFCGGEAILQSAPPQDNYFVSCRKCGATTMKYFPGEEGAIVMWNRRAAPANKPLTLEQLRKMDGEPVRISETDGWYGGYGIVHAKYNAVFGPNSDESIWLFGDYGDWVAFRPEDTSEGSETP